jgi:putative endonuclease
MAEVVIMNAKDILGRAGEQAAAEYLMSLGLRVLDRNWRCAEGELDIIATERRVLVVCEVKTRSDTRFGSPLEAISRAKRNRLRRLAIRWVVAHGVLFDEIRVDAIGVLKQPDGSLSVEHVRGVG